jgi:hypothetical protein
MENITQTMRAFIAAYIDCALWSSTYGEKGEKNLDDGQHALAPSTREKLEKFAYNFAITQSDLLCLAVTRGDNLTRYDNNGQPYQVKPYTCGDAGHDLWLTQNHHGAGYWDGDIPDAIGRALTDAAQSWYECGLYIDDDGFISAS